MNLPHVARQVTALHFTVFNGQQVLALPILYNHSVQPDTSTNVTKKIS